MSLALPRLMPISVHFLLPFQIIAVLSSLNNKCLLSHTFYESKIRHAGSVKLSDIDSEPFMRLRHWPGLQSSEDLIMVGRNAPKLIYMALSRYLQFPGTLMSLLGCFYELSVYYIQFPLLPYAEGLKPQCDYKYSVETYIVGRTCKEVKIPFCFFLLL